VPAGGNRIVTIGAAAGSLALLALVVLMLWPSDPGEYAFTSGRDQIDGETVGWVSKVESNTIHVNSGPFGGGVVPLVVTRATRITIGAKEGWFEDIRPGGQVKVAYELYHGRRFARRVELLVDEGTRRPARAVSPRGSTPAVPPGAGREPAGPELAPAARPAPAAPVTEPASAVAPAPRPAPVTARPDTPRAAEIGPPPRRQAAPAPARAPAVETAPASPRASAATAPRSLSAPEPARPVQPARPPGAAARPADPARSAGGGESTDGSAAVDWLLKGRR
jgi:hypothetical protein